jgi:hypothetical protein
MGRLTLASFRDRLAYALGDKKPASNEILDEWINSGYFEALGVIPSEGEKETAIADSIAGEWIYGLPDDVYGLISILYTPQPTSQEEPRSVLYVNWADFQRFDNNDVGAPLRYTRRDRSLYLWPTPEFGGEKIELQYIQEDCVLQVATDVTILPDRFDRLIHLFALKHAYIDIGLFEQSALMEQLAMSYASRVDTEREAREGAKQVGIEVAQSWEEVQGQITDGY